MMLLHLLEAHRQLLRLAREDAELLDDLLRRHLAVATAHHRGAADLRRFLTGSLERGANLLRTGHSSSFTSTALGESATAAATAGKRESRTRRPRTRHFFVCIDSRHFLRRAHETIWWRRSRWFDSELLCRRDRLCAQIVAPRLQSFLPSVHMHTGNSGVRGIRDEQVQ